MVNFDLEKKLSINNIIMIGVDEAGRGSWAGPLVATASWLDFKDYKFLHKEINDSKKLKSNTRKEIMLSLNNSVICWIEKNSLEKRLNKNDTISLRGRCLGFDKIQKKVQLDYIKILDS